MNFPGSAVTEDDKKVEAALLKYRDLTGPQPGYMPLMNGVAMPMHQATESMIYGVSSSSDSAPDMLLKVMRSARVRITDFRTGVKAANNAAAINLSPTVLGSDTETESILMRYLPAENWRVAKREDLESTDALIQSINMKKRFHLTAPLRQSACPFSRIQKLCSELEEIRKNAACHGLIWREPESFQLLLAEIADIERAIKAAGTDIVPVTGDSSVSNILISTSGEMAMVDFDWAGDSDPVHDFAGLCLEVCSLDSQIDAFTEMLSGKADPAIRNRIQLYMVVEDFMWGCWALAMHYLSPLRTSIEFYKYAQNRFLRCKFWSDSWDLAELKKSI